MLLCNVSHDPFPGSDSRRPWQQQPCRDQSNDASYEWRLPLFNLTSNVALDPSQRARYFVIKSHNVENFLVSLQHSAWATLPRNEDKFNEAFNVSVFAMKRSEFLIER